MSGRPVVLLCKGCCKLVNSWGKLGESWNKNPEGLLKAEVQQQAQQAPWTGNGVGLREHWEAVFRVLLPVVGCLQLLLETGY